ncbi:MAG TPA: hypothetical protein VFP65_10340 [Anaeromyxobacteraceae bacterium]|nr:hypothetical protein [Anaeromyxobacteraceae bacterium]
MLIAIAKVLLVLAAAFVAWLLVAGAVLDLLFRRAAARDDEAPAHTPPPGAGPPTLR